jgi:hypothetical protein
MDNRLPMAADDSVGSKILLDIKHHGWHRMGVYGEEDRPSWVYTIGLHHTYGHPEIVVFGFDLQLLMGIAGTIGNLVKEGRRFEAGTESPDIIERFNCSFVPVDRRWYERFFGRGIDYYGGESFPVLQCVYPDARGLYPWQAGFDEELREWQPRLAL